MAPPCIQVHCMRHSNGVESVNLEMEMAKLPAFCFGKEDEDLAATWLDYFMRELLVNALEEASDHKHKHTAETPVICCTTPTQNAASLQVEQPAPPAPPSSLYPPPPKRTWRTWRARRKHTEETDARMLKLHKELGDRWRQITRCMGGPVAGYTDDVVRNRILRLLKRDRPPMPRLLPRHRRPSPGYSSSSSSPTLQFTPRWTVEEDRVLLSLGSRTGQRAISWVDAVMKLRAHAKTKRTTQAVRNRHYRLMSAIESGVGRICELDAITTNKNGESMHLGCAPR